VFDPVGPLVGVAFAWVGALLASRRPMDSTGWLFCSVGLACLAFLGEQYAAYSFGADPPRLPGGAWMAWVGAWAWVPPVIVSKTLVLLLFPDGRAPSRRWRPVTVAMACLTVVTTGTAALTGGSIAGSAVANPVGLSWVPAAVAPFLILLAVVVGGPCCLLALLLRYRRSAGTARTQLTWFVRGAMAMTLAPFLAVLVLTGPLPLSVYRVLGLLSMLAIPIAVLLLAVRGLLDGLGVGDVKRFVDRSLVHGAVLLVSGAVYWLTFGFSHENRLLALAVVVAAAKPLNAVLSTLAERVQTASRARGALLELARRLDATVAPGDILPAIVNTVADALELAYVAVEVRDEHGDVIAADLRGEIRSDAELFDLVHRGEVVGRMAAAPGTPGSRLRRADRLLLQELSGQLAVAAYALRQTAALERARRRLVTEREEERARLRRDHHDGVKPALSGVICEIDAILNMCAARGTSTSLDPITQQARSARDKMVRIRADLRRLIDNHGPRSLDEFGLVGAVRHHVSTFGLEPNPLVVTVHADAEVRGLPTDVEVGAYFIICEAVENVRRHAGATRCTISLSVVDRWFNVEVSDDGSGLTRRFSGGTGLSSMEARAEELDGDLFVEPSLVGGTLVRARLPLPPADRT
jgi:signal transduction histidine kinase